VLSGMVSAFVASDGVSDTLTGPLVVTNRSGTGWRWSEAQWTFGQDGAVLCNYTDYFLPGGALLSANRPTAQRLPNGCGAPAGSGGSIEPNIVAAPDSGFSTDSVTAGPNGGLLYVVSAHYYMDRTSEMNPFIRPGGRADTLTNSTDLRVCRHALGLGNNAPVVVNFYTYNTVCQGFSLTPMYDGAHLFVKNNYLGSGNKCGQAWVFDTTSTQRQHKKVQVGALVNGTLRCL